MSLLQIKPVRSCPAVRSRVPGRGFAWEPALLRPRANLPGVFRFALLALLLIWASAEAALIADFAGTGKPGYSGDGGPAKDATINGPKGIAVAPDDTLYLADTSNHAIRRIDIKSGIITTHAGAGKRGLGGDGDPLVSALSQPHALWLDPDGTLFVSDSLNHRIRILRTK